MQGFAAPVHPLAQQIDEHGSGRGAKISSEPEGAFAATGLTPKLSRPPWLLLAGGLEALLDLGCTPMVRIAFARISDSGNKRPMSQPLCFCDSSRLRLIISIRYSNPMRMLQDVMSNCAPFWATFGLRFNIDVFHNFLRRLEKA